MVRHIDSTETPEDLLKELELLIQRFPKNFTINASIYTGFTRSPKDYKKTKPKGARKNMWGTKMFMDYSNTTGRKDIIIFHQ